MVDTSEDVLLIGGKDWALVGKMAGPGVKGVRAVVILYWGRGWRR